MVDSKSEKETMLKYIIQPSAREIFDAISSVETLQQTTRTSLSL